jgi:hypothetical protein
MTATVKIDTGRQRRVGDMAQIVGGRGSEVVAETEQK